jgi:hypothetical protein
VATLGEVTLMVSEQAEGDASTRWSPAEILAALDVTFRREWHNILASAPYERVNVVQVTSDAEGVVPFTLLTTGAGDDRRVFRNLIQLSNGESVYQETRLDLIPPTPATQQMVFYPTGLALHVLPAAVTNLRAVVNWMPVAPRDLESASSVLDFPEDGLLMLAMGAAALLLAKGGTETTASAGLLNLCMQLREDMLSSMRRRTNMPKFIRYGDRASQWASR